VVEQQAKQFRELDFEEWVTTMKREGVLYEPKKGYVALV